MTIVLWALCIVTAWYLMLEIPYRHAFGISYVNAKRLSRPSRDLLKRYRELPKESRPVPNLYRVLRELDDRFDKQETTYHFCMYDYDGWVLRWNRCDCNKADCMYKPYHELNGGLSKLTKAVASTKAREAEIRARQGGDMAIEIAGQMRQEAGVLNETRSLL